MVEYQIQLTEFEKEKVMKMKMDEENESWRTCSHDDYLTHKIKMMLRNIPLTDDFHQAITKATKRGLSPIWYENFSINLGLGHFFDPQEWMEYMEKDFEKKKEEYLSEHTMPTLPLELKESRSISKIPKRGRRSSEGEPFSLLSSKPSLIVAAGPSIRAHKHIDLLAKRGWKGVVLATDRMLKPLLEAGITPDNGYDLIVASVDGNRIIIPKWFQKENGSPLDADGVIGMFCSTVAPQTVIAAKEAGVDIYWFHGALDYFYGEDTVTGAMNFMIQYPSIAAGGNVGATCFTLSLYLWCNPVVFIGLDLGYRPDTPVEETAYYSRFVTGQASVAGMLSLFNEGFNPDFGVKYKQDPVFRNYTRSLLSMIETRQWESDVKKGEPGIYPVETINATEGGSLHHPTLVKGMKFNDVLDLYGER